MSTRIATLLYVVAIAYGTLFSTAAWQVPEDFRPLAWEGLRNASRADMLENVLGYIPFGALLAASLGVTTARSVAIGLTLLAGMLLSLSLETIQAFIPGRDSSATDVLMNSAGTFLGALGATFVDPRRTPSGLAARIRGGWFKAGTPGRLGAVAVVLWIASQLSPFIPTIDVATVRQGFASAWRTASGARPLELWQVTTYACYLTALGVCWSLTAREGRPRLVAFSAVVLAVLALKPFFLGRTLSLEAFAGFAASFVAVAVLDARPPAMRAVVGVALLCAGFIVYELVPAPGRLHGFNWLPFRGEMNNTLKGFMSMLGLAWVFFTLGATVRVVSPAERHRRREALGGLGVLCLVALCEWLQQRIPGRYGDVTTVAIAVAAWLLAWRIPASGESPVATRMVNGRV